LYQLFPRTAYYILKEIHQFNPYESGVTFTTLTKHFNSINPVEARKTQSAISVNSKDITAKEILGNPNYQAICYGGFRAKSRNVEPTVSQITEDLRILSAMNIKVLRTYNVQYKEVSNLLSAIRALKNKDANFEMYVMLGAWID
jgi:hypothetical protein